MPSPPTTRPATPGVDAARPARPAGRRPRRVIGLVVLTGVLALAVFASLAWGARDLSLATVLDALVSPAAGDNDHLVVRDLRLPRTLVGALAGLALGLSGALMQGLTRNPIADPGLLGVNAGASLMVVTAITWFGVSNPAGFIWFAFLGAALAATLVYLIAAAGWEGVTPVKLALVGAAFAAVATSMITLVLLGNLETLDEYRFWAVGSLVGRSLDTAGALLPFFALGAVLALVAGRVLNAMAMGDDVARGLGQSVARGRILVAVAVVLLCGSATALVGPIAFVGLMVPHIARAVVGPDYRWILPYSGLLGATLLIVADVAGRLVVQPGELEAGLVVAVIGAPVMIAIIRRTRSVAL